MRRKKDKNMIQRIQSVYLLIVVLLGLVLYFMPVVAFTTPYDAGVQRMFELGARGLEEVTDDISFTGRMLEPVSLSGTGVLAVANLIIPILAFVIIFMYRRRIWQARLSIFLAMFCLGYYAVLGVFIRYGKREVAADWDMLFGSCIPLICFVLTLMAARQILKDEAKVRAADRLR